MAGVLVRVLGGLLRDEPGLRVEFQHGDAPTSSQLEGINFLPPEEPGGPPRRVTLSGVTIDGAGPEHGHFPSTELRET